MGIVDLVPLLFTFTLLVVGYVVGSMLERRHYKSIIEREQHNQDILIVASKRPNEQFRDQELVMGSVVISSDYFKSFAAIIRSLFGGNINAFETLLDRGRREAILRMKNQARILGKNAVFNVKLETSTISGDSRKQVGSIEVLAYGTAGIFEQDSDQQ